MKNKLINHQESRIRAECYFSTRSIEDLEKLRANYQRLLSKQGKGSMAWLHPAWRSGLEMVERILEARKPGSITGKQISLFNQQSNGKAGHTP